MPLFFASNAIYPLDVMPPWLRTVASLNPLTHLVDALRGSMVQGGLNHYPLGLSLGVIGRLRPADRQRDPAVPGPGTLTAASRCGTRLDRFGGTIPAMTSSREADTPPPVPSQPRNPLHGMTLEAIVTALQAHYGWAGLGEQIPIRCFNLDPSITSSLRFLRKTPWAREKVESLYLYMLREQRRSQR